MSSYFLRCCLGFVLVLVYLGVVVNGLGEGRNEYQHLLSLFSAIWDQRQMSFILL
jgi:hypothetical protein